MIQRRNTPLESPKTVHTSYRIAAVALACAVIALVGGAAALHVMSVLYLALIPVALGVLLRFPELVLGIFLVAMGVWTLLPSGIYRFLQGYFYPLTLGMAGLALLVRYGLPRIRLDKTGLILLGFSAYLFFSLIWTTAPINGLFKAQTFLLSTVALYFMVRWIYYENPQRLWRMVGAAGLLGLIPFIVSLIVCLKFGFGPSTRGARVWYVLSDLGFDYYGMSNGLQVSAVCAAALGFKSGRSRGRYIWLLLSVLYLLALVTWSQRAQIVGVALAVGILIAKYFGLRPPKRWSRTKLQIGALLSVLLLVGLLSRIGGAKFNPAFLATDVNISSRLHLYQMALLGFLRAPLFGHGLGSFSMDVFGVDARIFAHNLVLDVMFEGGLIGLFLLSYLLLQVGRYARRVLRISGPVAQLGVLGLALFLARLVTALFSADLSSWTVGPWIAMMVLSVASAAKRSGAPSPPVDTPTDR